MKSKPVCRCNAVAVRVAGRAVAAERLEPRALFSIALASPVTTPLSALPPGDPAAPVVADLDADGSTDVLVAFPSRTAIEAGFVQFGKGNGTGGFTMANPIDVGVVTGRPVVADFDGDDKLDLAFTNAFGGQVKVYRGNGDGTFGAAQPFAAGVSPEALAAGDLDGDGRADLVVGNRSDNTAQVRRGDATATLGDAVTLATAADPASVAVADFTGDGTLDVLAGSAGTTTGVGSTPGALQLFLNTAGTLNPTPVTTAGPRGVVATPDLNNDGLADVVVGVTAADAADVLLNNGDGTFTLAAGSTGSGGVTATVAADLDQNLEIDLVTAVAGRIDVLPGLGQGTFGPPVSFDAAGGSGPAAADVTGDGRADVLTVAATADVQAGRTLNLSVAQSVGPDFAVELLSQPPAAVLGGAVARVSVRVTNAGNEAFRGEVPLQVLASADATADDADALLLQAFPRLKLKPGQAKTVKLKVPFSVGTGAYTVFARVDPSGTTGDLSLANNTAAAAAGVTVADPFVDLVGAIPTVPAAAAPGQKVRVNLVVTNNGNVTASGRASLALTASADQAPDSLDAVLAAVTKKLKIAPGRSKAIGLKFRLPVDLAAGTYNVLGLVNTGGGIIETDDTNNVAVGPTQITVTA